MERYAVEEVVKPVKLPRQRLLLPPFTRGRPPFLRLCAASHPSMALLHWLYLAVLAAEPSGASGQNTLFSSCAVRTLAGGPGTPPLSGPPPGSADGASTSAQFSIPQDSVFDPASGNIYVADYGNQRVRVLAPLTSTVSTINYDFSQSVGPSDGPSALVVAPGRTIYVSTNRSIFLVVASQTPPLVVVLPTLFNAFTHIGGLALDAATLTLYVSDKTAQAIYTVDLNNPQPRPSLLAGVPNNPEPMGQRNAFDGSLSPGSVAARFAGPAGLAFDLFNRILFVADFDANAIRTVAVTPPFTVTTIAGDIVSFMEEGHLTFFIFSLLPLRAMPLSSHLKTDRQQSPLPSIHTTH